MRIVLNLLAVGSLLLLAADASELSLEFQSELQALGKPLLDLDESYRKRLRSLEASAREAGKLDEVLILQKEIEEIAAVPPRSFASLEELRSVRATYDEEKLKREVNRVKELQKVKAEFGNRFQEEIEALTRDGKIEEAVKVRGEWERLRGQIPAHSGREIPTNPKELIAYLTDTIWSWDDLRAKFTREQKIHGLAAESDVITWRPFAYEVTDDLTVRYGKWEVHFDSTFTKLETRNIQTQREESTVYGRLLGIDEGD